MKLYVHDEKHQNVNGELNLGEVSEKEAAMIKKIMDFLGEQGMSHRYARLVLANNYTVTYDKEDGFPTVKFE